MLIRIDYRTRYTYERAATGIVQLLRLTPAETDAQHVEEWRIDIDVDGALRPFTDPHGNAAHMFYASAPADGMTVRVTGEVDVEDAAGFVRGAPEPLPVIAYRRQTALTLPDAAIAALAADTHAPGDGVASLNALMLAVHARIAFVAGTTDSDTPATEVLKQGRGVCQDHSHLFITAARAMGHPARYVSGHLIHGDGRAEQPAAHAWAEAHVDGLGWIAFDAANGTAADARYVRVAVGLDALDAAPVRGNRRGGGTETIAVAVRAADARQWQTQSPGRQSQSQGGQSQPQSQSQSDGMGDT